MYGNQMNRGRPARPFIPPHIRQQQQPYVSSVPQVQRQWLSTQRGPQPNLLQPPIPRQQFIPRNQLTPQKQNQNKVWQTPPSKAAVQSHFVAPPHHEQYKPPSSSVVNTPLAAEWDPDDSFSTTFFNTDPTHSVAMTRRPNTQVPQQYNTADTQVVPTNNATFQSSAQAKRGLRIFTGPVIKLIQWKPLADRLHPVLFETVALLYNLPSRSSSTKRFTLKDTTGPSLECSYEEIDQNAPPVRDGQCVRCIVRFVHGNLQCYSLRLATAEEQQTFPRVTAISSRAIKET